MVYINKKLFKATNEIVNSDTKYGWILLGIPLGFFAMDGVNDPNIPWAPNDNEGGANDILFITQNEQYFYNCCIAGFTSLQENSIIISGDDEGIDSINYKFKGVNANSDSIVYHNDVEDRANTYGHAIEGSNGRLCLIQYQPGKDTDLVKQEIGGYYNTPVEYGDPYTIRRNEFAKGGSGELTDKFKRAEREFAAKKSYSGPAE